MENAVTLMALSTGGTTTTADLMLPRDGEGGGGSSVTKFIQVATNQNYQNAQFSFRQFQGTIARPAVLGIHSTNSSALADWARPVFQMWILIVFFIKKNSEKYR